MVRAYVRKGPRPWKDKDKRMAAAVRLRAEGKSLREIGKELAVSEFTVRCDLKRWQETHPNVVPLRFPPAISRPAGGNKSHLEIAPDETAPKIRRIKLWRSSPFARSGTAR